MRVKNFKQAMQFIVDQSNKVEIKDDELYELLILVYVGGGYTDKQRAIIAFDPEAVRNRGTLFVAKDVENGNPVGVIVVVPSSSPARVVAVEGECEIHLLAVKPQYRGNGVGKSLINEAISFAKKNGYRKVILWTQHDMTGLLKPT